MLPMYIYGGLLFSKMSNILRGNLLLSIIGTFDVNISLPLFLKNLEIYNLGFTIECTEEFWQQQKPQVLGYKILDHTITGSRK